MSPDLRETADVVDALVADGEAEGFGTRYDVEFLGALRELKAVRRGEFLCARCRMGEAQEEPPVEF